MVSIWLRPVYLYNIGNHAFLSIGLRVFPATHPRRKFDALQRHHESSPTRESGMMSPIQSAEERSQRRGRIDVNHEPTRTNFRRRSGSLGRFIAAYLVVCRATLNAGYDKSV